MLFRIRHRFFVALIVIGSLLFQQVAVAAYACDPAARDQPPAPEPASHCEHAQRSAAPTDSSPLCEKHCSPDLTVLTDTASLGVPALALPPMAFTLVVHEPAASLVHDGSVPYTRSDPPPRLRFCSLLI